MFTCSHCKNEYCQKGDITEAPAFCPTRGGSAETELERYSEEDSRMAQAAAIVEGRYYGHAWTGYDLTDGFENEEITEEMVYVTERGEKYHRDIDCRYLHVSARSVGFEEAKGLRNKDGSRYGACEYCGEGIAGGNVFITDYGNRYHSRVDCAGLKRKIYTIPISEVGGRGPCSGCGG